MTQLPKSYVDGFLVEWEANEYAAEVRMSAQTSKTLNPSVAARAGGTTKRAQQVREKLKRTVRATPEVVVKITSSCRGMGQVGRHVDYISRKGELELEDQDGFLLKGRDDLRELKADWQASGPEPIARTSQRRDTLNIVFSMPAFTDEVAMKRAVRAFASDVFNGHQYVFAYHTQASDPDPNPPAHPHVHLSVKIQGRDGRRLNPRKADLQQWRDGFAQALRAHGIEANATHRLARLQRHRGPSRAKLAMEARGQSASAKPTSKAAKTHGALGEKRLSYYRVVTDVLARSSSAEDRKLATELATFLEEVTMGPTKRVRAGDASPRIERER